MLVLTRNVNQRIMIGDDIVVTVVAVSGGRVKIGVDAPREIPVHREKVFNDIKTHGRKNHDGRTDGTRGARPKHTAETT